MWVMVATYGKSWGKIGTRGGMKQGRGSAGFDTGKERGRIPWNSGDGSRGDRNEKAPWSGMLQGAFFPQRRDRLATLPHRKPAIVTRETRASHGGSPPRTVIALSVGSIDPA